MYMSVTESTSSMPDRSSVWGDGYLYEQYEKLKKELAEMGMFDAAYKTKIPFYVRKLGVVTAQTGAAVRGYHQCGKAAESFY